MVEDINATRGEGGALIQHCVGGKTIVNGRTTHNTNLIVRAIPTENTLLRSKKRLKVDYTKKVKAYSVIFTTILKISM